MVNYGVKKTSKGVKQRTDEDKTGKQTRDRRRSDGEKNMDDIHRPYLIQRVLAAPLFKIQRSRFGCSPTLYTLRPTPNTPVSSYPKCPGFLAVLVCSVQGRQCRLRVRMLLKLIPEGGVLLVLLCLLGRCRIVFDEPSEVFGIVDFVAEHLFEAGGVK